MINLVNYERASMQTAFCASLEWEMNRVSVCVRVCMTYLFKTFQVLKTLH